MKSIIIIIPYFGKLPTLFPFWLQSALNNPTIDFLFITDANIQPMQNIKVINKTFSLLKEEIQSKFNFEIKLETPYKLCDFKPAYGYIFNEQIKDMTFGDLVILILYMAIFAISLMTPSLINIQ